MKSKAHIRGHPVHMILVPFPIAFLSGALLFDVLGVIYLRNSFWVTGGYLELAGILSGFIAAIPGLIDYLYTVPPRSSAKRRASLHAVVNIGMLTLFILAYFNRSDPFSILLVVLETGGIVLMLIGGWLGGTLVVRNQIGVNPRYANAGKWQELHFDQKSTLVNVAKADTLTTDQMMLIHIKNKRVVLAKTEDGYVAFSDHCSHRGGSLAGGSMICGTVQCPWHGSQFNVRTGVPNAGPAEKGLQTYEVVENAGYVYLNADTL